MKKDLGTSQKTLAYRSNHRVVNLPSKQKRLLHLFAIIVLTFTSIIFSARGINHLRLVELSTIPVLFIFGNFIIYILHRFVLHKNIPFFNYGYQKHTLMHHQYFTDEVYDYDPHLDVDVLLFPFWFVFFIALIIAPLLGFISFQIFSFNIACLTVIMTNLNYLCYEIVHYSSHLDEKSWVHKISFFRFMKNHHRIHHNKILMTDKNFDIIFPFFDLLFNTFQRKKNE